MNNIKHLASIALICFSGILMAQDAVIVVEREDPREKLKFGPKAGLNFSNVYDEKTDDFTADQKVGFAGGVFLHLPIGKYIGLQPELLYSQKGFKGNGTMLGSDYSFKRTTSYLDIPLLLALKPIENLTIVAGPQYSFLLNQNDKFDNTSVSYEQEQAIKNDNIRKNILGLLLGLDMQLDQVMLGFRVGWDIQNNNGNGSSEAPRYKNAWVQGTVGINLIR